MVAQSLDGETPIEIPKYYTDPHKRCTMIFEKMLSPLVHGQSSARSARLRLHLAFVSPAHQLQSRVLRCRLGGGSSFLNLEKAW